MTDTLHLFKSIQFHPQKECWFEINREKTYRSPVLLAGRQLECLTNNRYHSGGHLVRSYPSQLQDKSGEAQKRKPAYRYSIVFVLRAHSPVPVNTELLTTRVTGKFSTPLTGITAEELLRRIQADHFNINAGIGERDEQRRKLAERKKLDSIHSAEGKDDKDTMWETQATEGTRPAGCHHLNPSEIKVMHFEQKCKMVAELAVWRTKSRARYK